MHTHTNRSNNATRNGWIVAATILVGTVVVSQFLPTTGPSDLYATTLATVTVPPTWTGGIPTADFTPQPDGFPTVASNFWDNTSTPQSSGLSGTPTRRPNPSSTP